MLIPILPFVLYLTSAFSLAIPFPTWVAPASSNGLFLFAYSVVWYFCHTLLHDLTGYYYLLCVNELIQQACEEQLLCAGAVVRTRDGDHEDRSPVLSSLGSGQGQLHKSIFGASVRRPEISMAGFLWDLR